MSRAFFPLFGLLFLILVFLMTGCDQGPNTGTVSGVVTLDGKPTAAIQIRFSPASGRPGVGFTDAEGRYTLRYTQNADGCIPGPNRVTLEAYSSPADATTQFLPERYNVNAGDNPELQVEVKPGKNVFNFDLLSQ